MLKFAFATGLGLIIGFALTSVPDQHEQSTELVSQVRLDDAWDLRIRVDEARVGGTLPNPREHTGAVALLQIPIGRRQPWMAVSGFTHAGVFTDNFGAVGLSPAEGERIPLAAARMVGADSVEVVLNPTKDHGSMVLRGLISGKRVRGRWEVTGYVPGARGTFEMTPLD